MIGAGVAGPSIIQGQVRDASQELGKNIPMANTVAGYAKDSPKVDPLWHSNRINQLQSVIEGNFNAWQQRELDSFYIEPSTDPNILGLKSISESHKLRMIARAMRERKKNDWIRNAKEQLKEMLRFE